MPEDQISSDDPAIEPAAALAGKYIPIWAWAFAAICLIVPVSTAMSGYPAISGVAGVVCAIACIFAARNSLPVIARVLMCCLITAGSWVLYIHYSLLELFDAISQIH